MKLEDQVCSLELAKRLKELGVKQESVFFWVVTHDGWEVLNHTLMRHTGSLGTLYTVRVPDTGSTYSAFSLSELGEMLPPGRKSWRYSDFDEEDGKYLCEQVGHSEQAHTEADARAKVLIYLLENNLITL